jgi:hypothetical protein
VSRERHSRQVLLADVGEEGQARLAATTAVVDAEGLAGAVEARYLAGAGVGKLATRSAFIGAAASAADGSIQIVDEARARLGSDSPPPFEIRDPSALDVALGAWRALAHVRRAVLKKSDG